MRRVLLLIVLLAAMALPATSAAAPRQFYGTIGFTDPTQSEFERLGAGNVGTVRVNMTWSSIEGKRGTYWWEHYDRVVGDAASSGIRVLATVYGSPSWAARKESYPPRRSARDEFSRFAGALARRYGFGGSFWAENPGLRPLPIRTWQFWNEPSSPTFWSPRPNPRAYAKLLKIGSRAIRRVNGRAEIVLAGLFPSPNRRRAIPMERYLRGLYRCRCGIRRHFSAIAIHPYAVKPRDSLRVVRRARRILRQVGDRRTKIWVTEVGWASTGARSVYRVGPVRQGRYLRRTFRLMAKNRHRYKIRGVIWFAFKDVPRGKRWIFHTGLFNRAFHPKPAWRQLVRLTGGRP